MHNQFLQSYIWSLLPYLVLSLGVVISERNYFHEWDLWMGYFNGTVIATLVFLLNFYSSTFGLIMHQSIWIPWDWTIIPGDSDKGLADHIGYWLQYFRAFSNSGNINLVFRISDVFLTATAATQLGRQEIWQAILCQQIAGLAGCTLPNQHWICITYC